MWFIGDVHSRFQKYMHLVEEMPVGDGRVGLDCSIQVGDMGVGFPARSTETFSIAIEDDQPLRDSEPLFVPSESVKVNAPILSTHHRFIRGNHDDPEMCHQHPCFLGEFGYLEKQQIYFISGGYSIDYELRTPGVDWWPDEELSEDELREVVGQVRRLEPRIIVSHEGPTVAKEYAVHNFAKIGKASRTEAAMQRILGRHRPEFWIFGHHHVHVDVELAGTRFVGLNEMIHGPIAECIFEIPGLNW